MKKLLLAFALVSAASLSFATQPGNNGNGNGGCGNGQQTNGCTAGSTTNPTNTASAAAQAGAVGIGVGLGGSGGAGGKGGDAKAYGGDGGSAAVLGSGNSSVKNENANSVTGYGGSATGNGAGNTTSINVAAPVIPKPAANSAYVGDLPQIPQGSCRLFIGGGGTTRDGSATGMLPIGNDQTCLSTRALEVMKQINATVGQTVFGKADMLDVACQIEGMDKLAACKR